MSWLYILLIVIGVAVVAVKIFELPIGEIKKKSYRYQRKNFFMTKSEHEFFDILLSIIGNKYHVFPQVLLPTVVDNKVRNGQNWKAAFRHISQKSVDFVICDKAYIKPLVAIELDDASHERYDRQLRDEEVERILKEAGLPLVRFVNHGSFNKDEIKGKIFSALTNA